MDDFTIGLVVRDRADTPDPASRSARYIIEPGGVFRSSFGGGSDGLTYPPMTRRLSPEVFAQIKNRVSLLDPESLGWERIGLPIGTMSSQESRSAGYILEIRRAVVYETWFAPIDSPQARDLATEMARLAWAEHGAVPEEPAGQGRLEE